MSVFFEKEFPDEFLITPYKNNHDYICTEFKKVEMLIDCYLKAKRDGDFKEIKKDAIDDFRMASFFTKSRLNSSKDSFFVGEYVKKIYKLSPLEWFCLMCGVWINIDKSHMNKFLRIENDKSVNYNTVMKLYFFVCDICEIDDYYNIYTSLSKKMNSLCFDNDITCIDNTLFKNIMSNAEKNYSVAGIKVRLPQESNPLLIRENVVQKMCGFLKNSPKDETVFYLIKGVRGSGKKTLSERFCDILKKGMVYSDIKQNFDMDSQLLSFVTSTCREAVFNKSYICVENFENFLKDEAFRENRINFVITTLSRFARVVLIFLNNENDNIGSYFESYRFVEISLGDLTPEESFLLWDRELSGLNLDKNVDVREMANKFVFSPKQIKNTVVETKRKMLWQEKKSLDKFMICESAYNQVSGNLSDKATLIRKKHSWDELVMRPEQKEIIKRACDQIRYKHIVYDKWGMKNRVLYGRGLSMLFTGPPGTGKTMAAQVVAHELGLEIYKVDLSKVVSKYIGESEKNLGEVFDSAKKSNVILLFDETDALFGKRTEVKDSHDKNANLETSYLLQKMEEYDGITIMTTNFIENIDKAFFRRISYVVHFAFPDVDSRKEIWMKMYPEEMPLSKDIDFDYLGKNFEIAGGSIKNVVITSSFMAASKFEKVGMKHIIKALEYEIKKQGKIVSKSDFAEYGYLL